MNFFREVNLRGKSFRYTAIYPDGKKEVLLDIPKYDFNWQTGYRLAEPMTLPVGSKIFCEAVFDNSANNPNNPDPMQLVTWGDQTYDEMMIGYFDIVTPRDVTGTAAKKAAAGRRQALIGQLVKQGLFQRLDVNHDNRIERSELPERFQKFLDEIDRNQDGVLTLDEIGQ